ncbi:nuclear transport factor 2 family protein [Flavobacteriaceae bacterium F08102]|nr:nuclear transport factor 2 family protein [Flavobacteriaceae bacterium F08102]
MKKGCTFGVILLFLGAGLFAQGTANSTVLRDSTEVSNRKALRKVIDLFFEALQNGDSTLIKQTMDRTTIKIQTTGTNRAGNEVLITQKVDDFLKAVASKKPADTYEERCLSYSYRIDGAMAHVWIPYEFYYNDEFSHCGVNSFQFFNDGNQWRIIYLIDTRRRNNCK